MEQITAFLSSLAVILAVFLSGILGGLYIGWKMRSENSSSKKETTHLFDQTAPTLPLFITTADKNVGWWLRLNQIDQERLEKMSENICHGIELTGSNFGGRGRIWSRPEYENLITLMIQQGWVIWKNRHWHNQGVCITTNGWDAFRYLAGIRPVVRPPSPTLNNSNTQNCGSAAYAYTRTQESR